jgi:peptidoglycan/LPS O-acetylase OafA/YrhL
MDNRVPGLDALRGISILIVMIGHYNKDYYKNELIHKITDGGGLGVIIFFAISGYLITTLLLKEAEKNGDINLRAFYIRRILRIQPLAYLYLICVLLANFFLNLDIPAMNFILGFLFLKNISGLNSTPDKVGNGLLVGHYWSLAVEEQFYLLYPFILKAFKTRYYIVALLLIGAIVLINAVRLITMPHTYFIFHYETILWGCLLGIFLHQQKIANIFIKQYTLFSLFLAGTIVVLPLLDLKFYNLLNSVLIVFFVGFTVTNSNKDNLYKLLNNKITMLIGNLSYSLYIWQQFFTMDIPIKRTYFFYINKPIVWIPILFALSLLSYFFYEKRFLALKSKFQSIN